MNFLKFIISSLLQIIKALPFQWLITLKNLIKAIIDFVRDLCRRKKLPHSAIDTIDEDCQRIDHPSFHRADPLIYSQKYLKSLGLAVTWDNPDIKLKRNGVVVTENDLLPDTDYVIEATIWNNSYDAPAVGVGIDFAFLSFGAGTTKHSIGSRSINLGVKGGNNHPSLAEIDWRTPSIPGHYCLQVDINWFDDANPANNMGQNNIRIEEPQSPALFDFKLKNDTDKPQRYVLKADSYVIPQQRDCSDIIVFKTKRDKWNFIKELHDEKNYPIPDDWIVDIQPATVSLTPNDEIQVNVSIEPPDNFVGTKAINVNAYYQKNTFAGGVTLYVSKQN